MSKEVIDDSNTSGDTAIWAKLLEDIKQEDAANPNLTDEQKRLLEELDRLSDEEWEPIICEGEPMSETIIKERGER